jgi:hypothetical protein
MEGRDEVIAERNEGGVDSHSDTEGDTGADTEDEGR